MRLTSELWVKAYIRRCQAEGDFATLIKRGAERGGAIFIIINHLDGLSDLYAPAPQVFLENNHDERTFYRMLERQDVFQIEEKLDKEKNFDPDLWVVERENNQGKHSLDFVITLEE